MNKIEVTLKFSPTHEEHIGVLNLVNEEIYFKYDSSFLKKKINLSPFKLKFDDSIQKCPAHPFNQLFGLFADSLPDAWGRLLVDRHLISMGELPDNLTPLDRLALVGQQAMGALTYQPEKLYKESAELTLNLAEYAKQAIQLLTGNELDQTTEFYRLGGTSGGARPKIQVIYNEQAHTIQSGAHCTQDNESFWIIKFPSHVDFPDIAQVEYAYYLMAKAAGITMSDSRLFSGNSNQWFFGTKRFDRDKNKRIHMHSVAGLLHDDYQKSMLDYGHILDATLKLEKNKKSLEKVIRLALFNVLACNQDDHSKNFAFLMNEKGVWEFAPAFDLTFSPNVYGFQTTSVAGKNKGISKCDFEELAGHFGIPDLGLMWNQVREVVAEWKHYAQLAGVSHQTKIRIQKHLNENPRVN